MVVFAFPESTFLYLGFALDPSAAEFAASDAAAAAGRGGAAWLPLPTGRWRTGRPEDFLVS